MAPWITILIWNSFRWWMLTLAALAVAVSNVDSAGILGLMSGIAGGIAAGEGLYRKQVRLLPSIVCVAGCFLLVLFVAMLAESWPVLSREWSAGAMLQCSIFLRMCGVFFLLTGLLRRFALQFPLLLLLELVTAAGMFAFPFISRRDGQIFRPLWFSDWAWGQGMDPGTLLAGLGIVVTVVFAALLVAETRKREAFGILIVLVFLGMLMGHLISAQEEKNTSASVVNQAMKTDYEPQPSPPNPDSSGSPPSPPLAVVTFGDDYVPPEGVYFFRQEVWTDFNGQRLVPPESPSRRVDVLNHFPVATETIPFPFKDLFRKQVHATVSLLGALNAPLALDSPLSFSPNPNPNPRLFIRSYQFLSNALLAQISFLGATMELYPFLLKQSAGNPAWSEEDLNHYLEWPDDPRYQALAREIRSGVTDKLKASPLVQAHAVIRYLEQNTSYSLKATHTLVKDPTADFLFGNRIGYCTHLAHAAVYLWRSLGIPSRVATGFMVSAREQRGGSLVIKGHHSHAWPELFLEDYGWIVLNPTPETVLDHNQIPPDDAVTQMLGEMNQTPLNYESSQDSGFTQVSGTDTVYDVVFQTLVLITGVSVLLLYGVKIWRRKISVKLFEKKIGVLGYRVCLDRLSDAGRIRTFGETREAFADRVARDIPGFAQITRKHLEAVLGGERMHQDIQEWRQLLQQNAVELKSSMPPVRWWTGLLNPVSFFWSK
ncbi:MAG: transglutaminase domain-containing protein [SAR324 cluster bacterium]|nr:transglutaminase domain-containing protein [SAR324 cluster bacterium]